MYSYQSKSDVIMLQEFWFDESFTTIFDEATKHLFHRIAERRPSGIKGQMRDDGMCCLVRKDGKLELIKSQQVLTGPQRISQLIHCRERVADGIGRDVHFANSHLSFPGDPDPVLNEERQANEARIILEALSEAANASNNDHESLQIICGDFNSNSCGLAASLLESPPYNFINCASATAQQMLSSIGGPVNIGVTHCNHLGEKVSVDHIFLRLSKSRRSLDGLQMTPNADRCAALAMGYLDDRGSRILNVHKEDIVIEGRQVLSDHRPVTANIHWPRISTLTNETLKADLYINVTMPLDPLEPAWGIVQ
jgi:endonuclease/exonuclease/phosphatase family metal-dependent hydrolase